MRVDENGDRVPGRRLTYKDLKAERVVHWPYSTFTKIRRSDPYFPRGLKDGKRVFYDADQMADYVAEYWSRKEDEVRRIERDAYEASLPPPEERRRAYRELQSRFIAAFLHDHPGLLERLFEPFNFGTTANDFTGELVAVDIWETIDGVLSLWPGDERSVAAIMAREPQRGPMTYRVGETGALLLSRPS